MVQCLAYNSPSPTVYIHQKIQLKCVICVYSLEFRFVEGIQPRISQNEAISVQKYSFAIL